MYFFFFQFFFALSNYGNPRALIRGAGGGGGGGGGQGVSQPRNKYEMMFYKKYVRQKKIEMNYIFTFLLKTKGR